MKLCSLRISNFQSFGPVPTPITFEDITYLLGPNGAGKTAVLQALCRLFAFEPGLRRIRPSDFHVPIGQSNAEGGSTLWLEAEFNFPETADDEDNDTVAPHFDHMRLQAAGDVPRVRYRLTAMVDDEGDVEESLVYVTQADADGNPTVCSIVPKHQRNQIHLHYIPARRDPSDHIAYGATALLGRLLRATQWGGDRNTVKELTDQITNCLAGNASVKALGQSLNASWKGLHKGAFFAEPKLTFVSSDIEMLLRHMSVSFTPGHGVSEVDFSRLSDGQKSMLYLSLVLAAHSINRDVKSGKNTAIDPAKLKPPAFTILAMEEPENSLSPQYLGRIVNALKGSIGVDAQALIATHAPSMLRRVDPENIRYLRLGSNRCSLVSGITLPAKEDVAHKFVREAVQAFPEIYFSRLVVLGEGDSEEIVLPRILQAKGAPVDESAVTIAPLGGRHVNHFWRLLSQLGTPYITLLDLDLARYQGGWGRLKYVNDQLALFQPFKVLPYTIPAWDSHEFKVRIHNGVSSTSTETLFDLLEQRGVFFSAPLDLDFAMLTAFPLAFNALPAVSTLESQKAVLGKSHQGADQYSPQEQAWFDAYHHLFKLGSKPAAHLTALSSLSDADLLAGLPPALDRLANAVIAALEESPE
ncbi:TOPRIM nucleotidyl transferase/hydrolase domain-containing protein [Pseudomonas sp. PS01303]|uniref:ATP-dependent nuclease n=1 Tax=Pseudomonas sp. PS01303 TaxID=2991439 RepID=UPI00249C0B11|nr:TOPRIM nucleotidyl transferase/hydrolase domain-containing protein [Pseudomonas sp. PS01303]